ncbi:MAG: DciA family protein [Rhodospirillaceae bacterium]|nr:DciA family protein [Rhodospirillaceae bacterium]
MPPDSLAELLNSGNLGKLAAESRRLQDLADSVRQRLPDEEAAHLVAANTDDEGRLVLVMDASVWAARVRYMARELGEDRIRVRVIPHGSGPSSRSS